MASIDILGKTIGVEFAVGEGATAADLDRDRLMQGAQAMAALIKQKDKDWPRIYRDAYHIIHKIVFFAGKVMVNGYLMDRPCCDQAQAIFYWEAKEFLQYTDADVHGQTFFHDCWHVVQFRKAGNEYARDPAEQVEREVDAIGHQIEVARILGCDANEIGFLERFRADQDAIRRRLEEGVTAIAPHTTGAMHPR
jgi:hypothetical protein